MKKSYSSNFALTAIIMMLKDVDIEVAEKR